MKRSFTLGRAILMLLCSVSVASASATAAARLSSETYPYQSCFEIAARMHEVPVDLLLAVAATESAWNPDARSAANAHGIMQIQWPGTARHLGVTRVAELYNPCLNIELGARYLRELLDASDGDVERALASYNYGPGRIKRAKTLPAGAIGYASKVASHQSRINQQSSTRSDKQIVARGVVFKSSTRAEHFARSLNAQIKTARFSAMRESNGQHRVQMHVSDKGLSTTDVATLDALGWSSLGEAP